MSSEQADPGGSNPGDNTGEAADTVAYREYAERVLDAEPELSPAMFAGRLFDRNGVAPDAAIDLYDELTEARQQDPDAYIDDPDFGGDVDAVREHYERVRPVYGRFADLDGAPTTAWIGNTGVYAELEYLSDDDGNAVVRRRAKTIERDLDAAISDISHNPEDNWRTLYNHTSWKDPSSVYDGIATDKKSELGQGDGLAGYGDVRGFPLWVDLDLRDNDDGADGPNYKLRRGDLDADVRETVERAYRAYVDEFAALFGGEPADVAVFDSGGGGYLYTPAALTLPIGERYADDSGPGGDARKLVFQELRKRLRAYGEGSAVNQNGGGCGFEGIETRVNDRVDGAGELLDPDWVQNVNRQSKAPLAIHGDHDVVVTPARPAGERGRIEYEPTLVSAVDDELIEWTAREAEKIVTVPDRDVLDEWTETLVTTLFPDVDGDSWQETLDSWLAEQGQRRHDQSRQRAADEQEQGQPSRDSAAIPANEWLDEDLVREALDHIDPDSEYPVWRNIGFALAELFSTGTAKRVFRDWSQEGVKWDGDASEQADRIINGGGTGRVTRATLVYHAKQGGWEPPTAARSIDELLDEHGGDGEPIPFWLLRQVAVEFGVCDRDDLVEHETDSGETYLGFDGPTYNAVLRALDDEGIDHGREPIETEKRSDYYDVDLAAYVDSGDPWTDPDTMLRACLRARDGDAVSEHATPPTMALLPLRRDVLGQPANQDMSSGTKGLLEELYHELDGVDELDGVLRDE